MPCNYHCTSLNPPALDSEFQIRGLRARSGINSNYIGCFHMLPRSQSSPHLPCKVMGPRSCCQSSPNDC
eukprot:1856575-Pleurochrysis_carterae.AAC.1